MATKLVIAGGVAGGASAAARARRVDEEAEIILLDRGEHISFANCGLPYYIGNIIEERDALLVATPELFRNRFNVDIRNYNEVLSVDRESKSVKIRNQLTGEEYDETYDKLILSPGAEPVRPPLEGIDLDTIYTLRNIPDMDAIKKHVDELTPKKAVVVGGGFIGLEMAENLKHRGVDVSIVEMLDQVMAPVDPEIAEFVHVHMREKGVELRLGEAVKSFRKQDGRTVVTTSAGDIECDMVILSIGVRPENRLAKEAGLEIGERGGIKTDQFMRTSDPDIFAVGDAVEVTDFVSCAPAQIPLAGPANKQGRIAADNALGRNEKYTGTQGTSIVQVFDLVVAATGNSEKLLKGSNTEYIASYTHSGSHAGYYPGAEMMHIKLLFAPGGGKVLGAQIVGQEGVDKRIDVLATAIRAGMTVYDLTELELAYAPPFSSAKDPVNIAGYVATNILNNDMKIIAPQKLDNMSLDGHVILDVRSKEEVEDSGVFCNAVNMPIDDLRNRLGELDRNMTYLTYCGIGQRSYIAYRILVQNGFNAMNISGGLQTIRMTCKRK